MRSLNVAVSSAEKRALLLAVSVAETMSTAWICLGSALSWMIPCDPIHSFAGFGFNLNPKGR